MAAARTERPAWTVAEGAKGGVLAEVVAAAAGDGAAQIAQKTDRLSAATEPADSGPAAYWQS